MKTASRILGTAAFLEGYEAQDSPVYGAERRGAPVTAFTRFDDRAILERGAISAPDLVVIADESFLEDPQVRPLAGLGPDGIVLINSRRPIDELRAKHSIPCRISALDFTGLALGHTGSTAALSVALGTAAARLTQLDRSAVEQAVRKELEELLLELPVIEKNLELADVSFAATPDPLPPKGCAEQVTPQPAAIRVVTPAYRSPWQGTPSVASAPNTPMRKTGNWRVSRPVIDAERCTRCWICFVACPDGAIALDPDELPHIDYGVCKGCMVCREECPIDAIQTLREVEA
jgi:pyruvate ferredoxin oxidoreductase gamma subunit